MRFKIKCLNMKTLETYWVTVFADSINEATKLGERKLQKGFIIALIEGEY